MIYSVMRISNSLFRPCTSVIIASRLVARLSPLADAFNGIVCTSNDHAARTGLFQNKVLTQPSGFSDLVAETTIQCKTLLSEAVSSTRSRKMVQILDDMSDSLCRVADLADCVRMLHPNETYRNAASEACQAVGLLVEELNTYSDLYNASVRAASLSGDRAQLRSDTEMDQIDKRVLDLFIADFELSGVQLQDSHKQSEFVNAAAASMAIGEEFVQVSHSPAVLRPEDLIKLGASDVPQFESTLIYHPIADDSRASIRAATYQVYYAPIPGQEQRLTRLMQARHRMAQSAGFANFADRATLHSLAETSSRVEVFLNQLIANLAPLANHVTHQHLIPYAQMVNCFRNTSDVRPSRLLPWDVPYLLGVQRSSLHHSELADYFSLGACMEGVSQLATCLFGLRLSVEPTRPGEVWHPTVLKVNVYDNSQSNMETEPIGIVYCDLLDRPGKPAQDCHYTIRGGRQVSDDRYQVPVITLQLTLSPPTPSHPAPLLSLGQVENLFHEWGHALHSMLARTRYQHVTGTRCSTDLAELPSTLFEQFALDPRVTREYARHWSTGKGLSEKDLTALQNISIGRGLGQSVELIQQATYAQFDQLLHSGPPDHTLEISNNKWCSSLPNSAHVLSDLMKQAGLSDWLACDPTHLGAWPHRFSHLVGYGGRYYAYLMARAGAILVWRHCFSNDPWSSSNGQLYADKLLRLGGELHPSTMLSNLLLASQKSEMTECTLSVEELAKGLSVHVEEHERSAFARLDALNSPSLHQPGRTPGRSC